MAILVYYFPQLDASVLFVSAFSTFPEGDASYRLTVKPYCRVFLTGDGGVALLIN